MLWVFYGHEDGHVRKVTTSTEVTNSKEGDQRRRFAISDMDYLRAERHAAKKITLLGGTTAIRCIRPFQVNTIWPWPFPISATSLSVCKPKAPTTYAAGNSTIQDNLMKNTLWRCPTTCDRWIPTKTTTHNIPNMAQLIIPRPSANSDGQGKFTQDAANVKELLAALASQHPASNHLFEDSGNPKHPCVCRRRDIHALQGKTRPSNRTTK